MKIFHNEDLSQMKLKLGTTKKFSDDYSFIPIHIVSQDKRIPLLIQDTANVYTLWYYSK